MHTLAITVHNTLSIVDSPATVEEHAENKSKGILEPVRTLSVHHRLRNRQAGRSSSKLPLNPEGRTEAAAIALRTESPESSSGLEVLSMLENTDQMYAL